MATSALCDDLAYSLATGIGVTNLTVTGGTISLTVGTDLLVASLEIVIVTGGGLSTLATILGGTDGQVKVLIFQDNNVDMTDGLKAGGAFYLNHMPALTDFTPAVDDVLVLVNIGGDGGLTTHGYWKEVYRTISVK